MQQSLFGMKTGDFLGLFQRHPDDSKKSPVVPEELKVYELPKGEYCQGDGMVGDCWTEHNHQEILRDKTHGHHYEYVQLIIKNDLKNGVQRFVNISSAHEPPIGFMGGCWGGGGEFDLSNPKVYFDKLMSEKLEERKLPYRELSADLWRENTRDSSDFYRLIPMSNYIVMVDIGLQKYLKENGFDFQEWYKTYREIEENHAAKEYDDFVEEAHKLLIEGSQVMNGVKRIKESIRHKIGETKRYNESTSDWYPNESVDQLLNILKGIKGKVDVINQKLRKYYPSREGYSDMIITGSDAVTNVMEWI